jgi:hypothetical protein
MGGGGAPHPVVVLTGDDDDSLALTDSRRRLAVALTTQLSAVGYCVAVVNLCGFGEVGPAFIPGQPGAASVSWSAHDEHHEAAASSRSANRKSEDAAEQQQQQHQSTEEGGDSARQPSSDWSKPGRAAALVGEGPSGLSVFTGRSLVGRHAAELARVCEHLVAQTGTVSNLAAIVSADHTDAAVLHAVAVRARDNLNGGALSGVIPDRPALVLVDACASWASVGAAAYYAAPIFRTVVGALKEYDLPDLAAAALHQEQGQQRYTPSDDRWSVEKNSTAAKAAAAQGETAGTISRMLVVGPRSALLQPLAESEAQSAYSFVREVAGGNAQLKIVSGERTAKDAAAAIAAFLTTTS